VPALDSARFTGKVRVVVVVADAAGRAFTVEIEVPNPEHRIRPGMSAVVPISTTGGTAEEKRITSGTTA
jgi:multidrug efflux pump subunit AcrA (membrane-fusion protein)